MITLLSGTNRPENNTSKVARNLREMIENRGFDVTLLDLRELPPSLFDPSSYADQAEG